MNRFRALATVALVFVMLGGLSGCVNSSSSSSGPLSITTTSIPATATVGSAYAGATISATGGTRTSLLYAFQWSVAFGPNAGENRLDFRDAENGRDFYVCGAGTRFTQSPAYCGVVAIYDYGQ